MNDMNDMSGKNGKKGRTRVELLGTLPRGVGAELGVFDGSFSQEILCRVRPERLYLVDIFWGKQMSGDANGKNLAVVDMADMYDVLRRRFSGQPVEVVRGISYDWLRGMPAGSLSWVYIDTDHTYFNTVLELETAWAAVMHGGVIAGHDYDERVFPGVVRAVNEFAARLGQRVEVFDGDELASYRVTNVRTN